MTWPKVSAIAHTVLASVAVISLGFALYQNHQSRQLLAAAGEAFKALAYPVIKFQRYQWMAQPDSLSCSNPAVGINGYYQNFSGIPVAMEETKMELFMGDRPIFTEPSEVTQKPPGEVILAPGESLGISFVRNGFGTYYQRLQGSVTEPHLKFKLIITYRSLVSGQRYKYSGTVTILEDCRIPNQRQRSVGPERIESLGF